MRLSPTDDEYANRIGAALRSQLGGSHRATETVMNWTGASDRTARTWIHGTSGPSGAHLIYLARESPSVWEAVCDWTGHPEAILALDIHASEVALAQAIGALERLKRRSGGVQKPQ